jgi:hypothetical protein
MIAFVTSSEISSTAVSNRSAGRSGTWSRITARAWRGAERSRGSATVTGSPVTGVA